MTPPRISTARIEKIQRRRLSVTLGGHGAHPAINAHVTRQVHGVCSLRPLRFGGTQRKPWRSHQQPTKISMRSPNPDYSRGLDLQLSESTRRASHQAARAGKHLINRKPLCSIVRDLRAMQAAIKTA